VALKNLLGESLLDSVIDSAGGSIAPQVGRVLRPGGRVVLYGMTAAPQAQFTMREVLRNQQLIGLTNLSPSPPSLPLILVTLFISGSTMGSKADLQAATDFIAQHQITPVVSHVIDGIERAEEGFELLAGGDRFGKVVIKMNSSQPSAKL
jgi:NADPH:quinone reductase-like Zn-dependent oxidoreductase